MAHLKGINERTEKYLKLAMAKDKMHSQNSEEQHAAREVLDEYAGSIGAAVDYGDHNSVHEYWAAGMDKRQKTTAGYLGKHLDDILGEAVRDKEGGLAKNVAGVTPRKIGDKLHDDTAEAHTRYANLAKLINEYKQEKKPYQEIIKKIKEHIEDNIGKIATPEDDEDSEFLDDEYRENVKKALLYSIHTSEEFGIGMLARMAEMAKDEFEKRFKSNRDKALYVAQNLRAAAREGSGDELIRNRVEAAQFIRATTV